LQAEVSSAVSTRGYLVSLTPCTLASYIGLNSTDHYPDVAYILFRHSKDELRGARLSQRALPGIQYSIAICNPPLSGYLLHWVEVERSLSAYFPNLWREYFVTRSSQDLTESERTEFDRQCSDAEQNLLPRLHLTEHCGLKRGADRYWEFANPPATDIYPTLEQLHVLVTAGLIPQGSQSFHITIGALDLTPDVYYLMMLLEMLHCTKERIGAGFHSSRSDLSAGWARKGRAGIFQKEGRELQYGYDRAVEMRVLSITPQTDIETPLRLTSRIADTIWLHQNRQQAAGYAEWDSLKKQLKACLVRHGLPDCNWNKPNKNPGVWRQFMDAFDSIQSEAQAFSAGPIHSMLELNTFESARIAA
jgi:hypothetical protein